MEEQIGLSIAGVNGRPVLLHLCIRESVSVGNVNRVSDWSSHNFMNNTLDNVKVKGNKMGDAADDLFDKVEQEMADRSVYLDAAKAMSNEDATKLAQQLIDQDACKDRMLVGKISSICSYFKAHKKLSDKQRYCVDRFNSDYYEEEE